MNANPANTPVSQDVKKYSDTKQNRPVDTKTRSGTASAASGFFAKDDETLLLWKKRFALDEAPLCSKVILRVVVDIFFSLHAKNCRFYD